MKLDKKRLRLYAVTDRAWAADTDALLRQVADAIDGGAGIVQLREKHLDKKAFLEEARRFVALCREKGLVYQGVLEVVMPENYIALFPVPEE